MSGLGTALVFLEGGPSPIPMRMTSAKLHRGVSLKEDEYGHKL
jgi:hypothetical protein